MESQKGKTDEIPRGISDSIPGRNSEGVSCEIFQFLVLVLKIAEVIPVRIPDSWSNHSRTYSITKNLSAIF